MYLVPYILRAGGGQLRGVQTGTAQISAGNVSTTAAITAVTLNKAFIIFQYYTSLDWDDARESMVRGRINSTTQLTFNRSTNNGDVYIRWWVIEFTASSGATVQRGSVTMTGIPTDVTISAVNLSNAFPLISYESPGSTLNSDHFVSGYLSSTTNLRIQANSDINQIMDWEVIENPQWTVAAYSDTLTGTIKDTAITAVTLARALLISMGYMSSSFTVWGDDLFRCGFTSTTNIRAVRNATSGNINLRYHVITSSRFQAQHFQYSITAGNLNATQAISAVDLTKAFIKQSGINICHGLNSSTSNRAARLCARHQFNSTVQVQADRGNSSDSSAFEITILDLTNV